MTVLSARPAEADLAHLRGLRVLAFCDYFTEDSSGGAERVAFEVYSRLTSWGAEVQLITAVPPGMSVPGEIAGMRVRAVPGVDLRRALRVQAMLAPALLWETTRVARGFRPHVLHANSLHFQTTIAAAALRKRLGAPLVTTAHIGALDDLPRMTRVATEAYERSLGRLIVGRSRQVIAVSDAVQAHMLSLGVDVARCPVVPNGVDHQRFLPRPASDEATVPVIMFVGRLIGNKGPEVLLAALATLRRQGIDFRAVYVGDGPMRAQLEQATAEAGLDDAVEFRGHRTDVPHQLRQADLIVRPSQTEGMPLTVLEAMATRVCVVASDIPGNRSLVRDEENGVLVPPGQGDALAGALAGLIQNPRRRERLAGEGYRTALAHSWDACAMTTGAILAGAADREGAQS
jgi:glycosyltransferase involved in cell wall biosynthesis